MSHEPLTHTILHSSTASFQLQLTQPTHRLAAVIAVAVAVIDVPQVRDFFGSPDALHAAFWVQPQQQDALNQQAQQPAANSNSSPHQQQQQRQPQQQQPWLQIDHAAVHQLHEKLQACHDDAVKDACCSACERVLLHMSVCAKQHKPNPGFCRQVRWWSVLV